MVAATLLAGCKSDKEADTEAPVPPAPPPVEEQPIQPEPPANPGAIGFIDDLPWQNDLSGSLQGRIQFAQALTINANNNADQELPDLTRDREAMVMFIASSAPASDAFIKLIAYMDGNLLGERYLLPPHLLPKTDQNNTDDRAEVIYASNAWNTKLPWDWMQPGLSLEFIDQKGDKGTLSSDQIDFGVPSELVLQNIRIGMLMEPNDTHLMEQQSALLGVDYFQKVPVASLVVANYLPVYWDEIVQPKILSRFIRTG